MTSVVATVRNDATVTDGAVHGRRRRARRWARRASCYALARAGGRRGRAVRPRRRRRRRLTRRSRRREPRVAHPRGAVRSPRAAAAGACGCCAPPRRASSPRWERTNHAGGTVTLLEGPAYVAGRRAAARAGGGSAGRARASLGSGAFGALDDLAGDSQQGPQGPPRRRRPRRGHDRRGQDRRHRRHRAGRRRRSPTGAATDVARAVDTLVGGAVVAGAANLANLLDLRPGRALKATVLAAALLLLARGDPAAAAAPPPRPAPRSGVAAPRTCAGTRHARRHRGQHRRRPPRHRAASSATGRRGRLAALAVLAGADPGLGEGLASPGSSSRHPGAARARRAGAGPHDDAVAASRGPVDRGGRRADRRRHPARPVGGFRPHPGLHRGGAAPAGSATSTRPSTPSQRRLRGRRRRRPRGRRRAAHRRASSAPGSATGRRPHGVGAAHLGPRRPGAARAARALAAPWLSDLLARRPATRRAARARRHDAADLRAAGARSTARHRPRRGAPGPPPLPRRRPRTAAVLSLVVIASYSGTARSSTARSTPRWSSDEASGCSAGHHPRGRRPVSLPLLVPALRAGWRLRRPCASRGRRPPGRRARRGRASSPSLAQQAAVVATLWLTHAPTGDTGTFNVYTYVQAVYLLPVCRPRRPDRDERLPGAGAHATGRGRRTSPRPRRATLPGAAVSRAHRRLPAAVLIAAAPASRRLLLACSTAARRRRREHRGAGRAARRRSPPTRPGLVGFGLARPADPGPLRARPTHRTRRIAAAVGWSLAALLPLVVLAGGLGAPATTLRLAGRLVDPRA